MNVMACLSAAVLFLCGFVAGVTVMLTHARLQVRLAGKRLSPALLPRDLAKALDAGRETANKFIRNFALQERDRWDLCERDLLDTGFSAETIERGLLPKAWEKRRHELGAGPGGATTPVADVDLPPASGMPRAAFAKTHQSHQALDSPYAPKPKGKKASERLREAYRRTARAQMDNMAAEVREPPKVKPEPHAVMPPMVEWLK